jgi:hypothetical protein
MAWSRIKYHTRSKSLPHPHFLMFDVKSPILVVLGGSGITEQYHQSLSLFLKKKKP